MIGTHPPKAKEKLQLIFSCTIELSWKIDDVKKCWCKWNIVQ